MNRGFPAFVLCLLLISSVFIPISLGGYLKNIPYKPVSSNRGNTLYVGGSGGDNYTTIQDAIDNASNGDFIYVYDDSSPYNESLNIDKSVNLGGEYRNTTIIKGKVELNCDSAIIQRFKITGLVTINANDTAVSNNIIEAEDCIFVGEHFHPITYNNNVISDNVIISVAYGIKLYNSDFSTVWNNSILSYDLGGIILYGCDDCLVIDNSLKTPIQVGLYNGDIHLEGSDRNIIANNIILADGRSTRVGILLDGGCDDNNILNNYIDGDNYTSEGIALFESHNCILTGNIIKNCGDGVFLRTSWNTKISGNEFQNNDRGVMLNRLSLLNEIAQNNFINNQKSASFNMISIRNTWDGNFWDEPRTEPYAIIGALILFIPWTEYDYVPAQEPYDIEV